LEGDDVSGLMDADFEAYLRVGGRTVDVEDVRLLRAVAEHGSLNAAADALGRSYSRAHARITDLEDATGPLVSRQRGGAGGGGSRLTEEARELLAGFERLASALDGTATTERLVLDGHVSERHGDLVTVETDAGRVRALALTDDADVQVSFRADAVTLHRPTGAPGGDETSARNRFEATVESVDGGESVGTVTVDVGATDPLAVRVTGESIDRLELEPGATVVATVKATAVRATPTYRSPGEPTDPSPA
jgi:molybdate transport system regulatory protein